MYTTLFVQICSIRVRSLFLATIIIGTADIRLSFSVSTTPKKLMTSHRGEEQAKQVLKKR
jgi:hypothetical protein